MNESGVSRPIVPARVAAILVIAVAIVVGPAHVRGLPSSQAMACETGVELSVEATAAYDSAYGRYLDGIISNDSTVTVTSPVVKVTWVSGADEASAQQYEDGDGSEAPEETVWPRGDAMAPGQWTAFHVKWPESVPTTWTPVITAGGHLGVGEALRLRVDGISAAEVDPDTGMRTYTATVTNDKAFPVSSIEIVGAEWDGDTFVDATFSWDEPDKLAPGQSTTMEFHGKAPAGAGVAPEIFVEARERPVITLGYDTLEPVYGSPITFTLKLTRADGSPLVGHRTLKLFYSADEDDWKYVPAQTKTGVATITFTPDKPMYFKALYWGDGRYGMTDSAVVYAVPKVANTRPKAPETVRRNHRFTVKGRMSAGAKSAGKPVAIKVYRFNSVSDEWVYKTTVKTTPDAAGRYAKALQLKRQGSFKLKAYRSGVGYSKSEFLKVR